MRHEFLNERAQRVKKFAQPLLDEQAILVAVQYVFFVSPEALASSIKTQRSEPISLPQKIKTVFERSMRMQRTTEYISEKNSIDSHSFSGYVIATGAKVSTLRPGDAVACISVGDAVYSDLACISEYDAVLISDPAHIKNASVTGFALLAMHAVLRAKLQVGHCVCVIGFGAFGYLIVQLAKLSGATVILIDDNPIHLEYARSRGTTYCYNSTEKGWQEEVLCVTQRYGVDVTIIADSVTAGVNSESAITVTRTHGRIVLVGFNDIYVDHAVLGRKDIDFAVAALHKTCHHDELYRQHNTIVPFVKWRQRRTMQQILRLIEHDELRVDYLIENQIESNGGDAEMPSGHDITMGAIMSFPAVEQLSEQNMSGGSSASCKTNAHALQNKSRARFIPATRDSVRVGVIGADGFVQNTLMPLLSRMNNVTVHAIADIEQARAEQISYLYSIPKTCILDSELLQGDAIDAVVIASNNMFHVDRVLHALEHYKAVFVKEPFAATFDQLDRLKILLSERTDVPLCLDYYRSHAPFIRKIKSAVQKRSTPLMGRYRVNTCTSLRCEDQEDAVVGKIVGDACHFFDLFYYLTNARPIAVSVESMHTMRDDIFPTDNFSAQISFDDGSVCSLVYTSLGHEHFGGEHLELFFDAKAIVMQDFLTLNGYGLPTWFDEVVSIPDTGREHLISDFFTGLREDPVRTSMSHERIVAVAHIALIVDQLACAGGGAKDLNGVIP
jgi:predicted dehydrogenase/threonine dehydrogenase-like Zn-dependent dehydrogenase